MCSAGLWHARCSGSQLQMWAGPCAWNPAGSSELYPPKGGYCNLENPPTISLHQRAAYPCPEYVCVLCKENATEACSCCYQLCCMICIQKYQCKGDLLLVFVWPWTAGASHLSSLLWWALDRWDKVDPDHRNFRFKNLKGWREWDMLFLYRHGSKLPQEVWGRPRNWILIL